MARTVAIGIQDFETIRQNNCFYVDKTEFIREWWESRDSVTLITRPRRFGKTLNMSMLERFFSNEYAGKGEVFEGLRIWEDEKYREIQGTYPVIFLSFANVKERCYDNSYVKMCQIIEEAYRKHNYLRKSDLLDEKERKYFEEVGIGMSEPMLTNAINRLCQYLYAYYGKKVIILLDEYDTPMQEAYVNGYWDEIVSLMRGLFNATFKTNPYLERAVMTGITRVSRESMFSDLNNLRVVTTTSNRYADAFGFTEEEVFAAMEEQGLTDREEVKRMYDGFTFGEYKDIYNPWSIINYLSERKVGMYWANTSSNSLAGKLVREGSRDLKMDFEGLLNGGTVRVAIDEQIVYNEMDGNPNAIWSLLLASGYLKIISVDNQTVTLGQSNPVYELALTNAEVGIMFSNLIRGWFGGYAAENYNDFIKALLIDDKKAMNHYMNMVALTVFSSFDTGKHPSEQAQPERFYHGFVLGLLVELRDRYAIKSNRESGFGRYDIMLIPKKKDLDGIVIEFKVIDSEEEKDLAETVAAALKQIEEKGYEEELRDMGIAPERIRKYGFAFEGKKVLIG